MAKVTIELGDEIEYVAGNGRFMFGRLKSLSMIDVQRETIRYMDPQGQQHLFQGPAVGCSVQLDFVVEPNHFDLTPAEADPTIPPAASVENSQHIAGDTEDT